MAPILAIAAFVPSISMIWIATKLLSLFGHKDLQEPNLMLTGWGIPMAAVLGPLIETALLAIGLWVITRLTKNKNLASGISALGWAFVHGLQAPIWFIGVLWPFYVFSRAYLSWRPTGRSNAIGVAWMTHALHNSMTIGLIFLTARFMG